MITVLIITQEQELDHYLSEVQIVPPNYLKKEQEEISVKLIHYKKENCVDILDLLYPKLKEICISEHFHKLNGIIVFTDDDSHSRIKEELNDYLIIVRNTFSSRNKLHFLKKIESVFRRFFWVKKIF